MFATPARYALLAMLLTGVVVMPSAGRAQEVSASQITPSATSPVAETPESATSTPAFATPSSVLLKTEAARPALLELAPMTTTIVPPFGDRVRAGPNIAMMAVGGAALVVGLAIGGDTGNIVATTGGVIALVGLWRYLK